MQTDSGGQPGARDRGAPWDRAHQPGSHRGRSAGGVRPVLGPLFNDASTGSLSILYAATMDVPGGSYVGPEGLGHLRGYPTIHEPSRQARDPELARNIWDLSVALTGAAAPVGEPATVA